VQIAHLEYQLDSSILTQRTLRLRVGATDVQLFMDRAARKLSGMVTIPGFRRGKAPIHLVRSHQAGRVQAIAFDEIKRTALDQVFKQLQDSDKPFLPPQTPKDKIAKLVYGEPLEFSVTYLCDPAGLSKKPEDPQAGFDPLQAIQNRIQTMHTPGIPTGPNLPPIPSVQSAPLPELPE
jgi:hypothetical protein